MPLPVRVCTIHIYQFGCRHKMSKIFIVPFDQPEDIDRVVSSQEYLCNNNYQNQSCSSYSQCHTTPRHIATPAHRGHILLRTVCEQRVAALMSFCYFTMTLTFESQRFSFPVMNEHIVDMLKGEPWRDIHQDVYITSAGITWLVSVCTSCSRTWGTVWSLDQSWGNTDYRIERRCCVW